MTALLIAVLGAYSSSHSIRVYCLFFISFAFVNNVHLCNGRCKRYNIPIEKVYNRTQREKFMWAIQMATEDYKFTDLTSDKATNQLKQEDEEEPDDEAGDEDDF